ncbi:MAG: serpin family protein [Anaerolineae bacterium]
MSSRNRRTFRRFVGLALILGILLGGCATPAVSPTEEPPSPGVEPTQAPSLGEGVKVVASDVEREEEPNVPASDLAELAAGNNDFAFELYQALRGDEGNLFYSPYSISTALAMAYAGARGNTAEQMSEVLNYTLSQDRLHPAMNALAQELRAQQSLTLTVANSLWPQEGYPFLDTYLDLLARNYGAGLHLVDYIDPQAREAARLAINRWVEAETQGKIEELILEDMLSDLTRLVLANAIYFKADWEEPFRHGTNDDAFYLLDGTEVTVPMMSRRAGTPYVDDQGYQAVELPYKGGRMRMVVIVPAEGEFAEIETGLDNAFAQQVIESMVPSDLKLYLPKFSYDARLALKQTLIEMGMPDAFDEQLADFSGMDGTDRLLLSRVAHKAFVAVDEEGTEAAAATGVVVEVESMPIQLRVDRPFIYFIYDTEQNLVLFVGRVMNPVASE